MRPVTNTITAGDVGSVSALRLFAIEQRLGLLLISKVTPHRGRTFELESALCSFGKLDVGLIDNPNFMPGDWSAAGHKLERGRIPWLCRPRLSITGKCRYAVDDWSSPDRREGKANGVFGHETILG